MERMKRQQMRTVGLMTGMCGFLVMAFAGQAGLAQQVNKGGPSATASSASALAPGMQQAAKPVEQEEEETAKPDKPGTNGIKIHGHWVMDIKNPDGTLVKHLDFQNSLTTGAGSGNNYFPTGDQLLAAVLSGTGVISDPGILFVGFNPGLANFPPNSDITHDCAFTSYAPSCQFLTTTQSILSSNNGNGYTLGQSILIGTGIPGNPNQTGLFATVNFSPTVSWVLTGNWTVPSGFTSLTAVQTWLPICIGSLINNIATNTAAFTGSEADRSVPAVTMAGCAATTVNGAGVGDALGNIDEGPLTSTLVPGAPQAITPGQIITVTVTISFS